MKLAISNIAWSASIEELAAAIMRDADVQGLEVAPTMLWPQPLDTPEPVLEAYRDRWLDRGVRIVSLQALLFGRPELVLFADDATRRQTAEHLRGMARLAATLGASVMVFGSPGNRRRGDLPFEAAMNVAASFFQSLAGQFEDLGLSLCIEGNPASYGCDFLTTTAEARELVRRIDRQGIRLQLDTSTMTVNGEDYAKEIAASLPFAGHFHASEPQLAPVGTGGTDHAAAASALRDGGYSGWVSVEMRERPEDRQLTGVEAAVTSVRRHYGAQ
ncbi:MAG: sugar phosphate isomerase/epimerase family protein [Vicinamibacterales bacterium]